MGGWNVGFRAVLGLLFNPLPFPVDVIPIIAFPIVVFPIRIGNFLLFSRVGYFRLPVLERKAKSEAWLYEGIAMLVRISDTPFFIDDAVNAFLHGIVAIVIPVWDIKACGMAVAGGYGRATVMIRVNSHIQAGWQGLQAPCRQGNGGDSVAAPIHGTPRKSRASCGNALRYRCAYSSKAVWGTVVSAGKG